MTGTGITNAGNIIAFATEYENDILLDTFSTSIPFTVPATNSSSEFEIIGKDSIHYTGSNLFGSGGSGTPAATGAKFSIFGNILTLTSYVVQDKVQDEGGGETLSLNMRQQLLFRPCRNNRLLFYNGQSKLSLTVRD
jgi:hypothetical protein